MTAVKGPFVFTSDQFKDAHITKALSAECKSLALQLEAAPITAFTKTENAGLQTIGWGIAHSPAVTWPLLNAAKPDVWMPQAENTAEFDAMIECFRGLQAAIWNGPIEPVMTAGGMDIAGTDAEKVANRQRRHNLLASFGVSQVWVEVYKQDADKSGHAWLGDVNHMISFFEQDLLFGAGNAHPVLGLWDASQVWAHNPYRVNQYDLSRHGRTFGAWRAEQMSDTRYLEMRAVTDLPPVPPPSATVPPSKVIRADMDKTAHLWLDAIAKPQPQSRIQIASDIVRLEGISDESWRAHAPAFRALVDQAEADE